ncbi:MAG: hypothetical protein Q7T33_04770 [Dehalococcoidia bacterium]|nr:hypothetical protein [Dehalococcoidia bacterium]
MSAEQRLNKVYPGLSARERALLVLQAWKEDTEEDRLVRSTIPDRQVSEFNRYIDLMNGANRRLGPYLVILAAFVEQIDIRYGWYCAMRVWGADVAELRLYIFRETEHKKRGGKKRQHPDWGLDFAVFPDSEAVQVARLRDERARVRAVIKRAATPRADLLPRTQRTGEPSWGDEIAEALLDEVASRAQNYWREVLAIDAVVDEIKEEFGGEDPLVPVARGLLESIRASLAELHEQLHKNGVKDPLPKVDDDTLSRVRHLAGVDASL